MRVSIRKWVAVLCICMLLIGSTRFCVADELTDTEAFFTAQETLSGLIEVPGKGITRYYAQNDGVWGNLIYESDGVASSRPFRDSGCGPTALAMAVARLIPEEKLSDISNYAKTPYSLCSCSLNRERCLSHHARYILTSQRDFVRFLPLVFGAFAAGNNSLGYHSRGVIAGTSTGFFQGIADIYGLDFYYESSYDKAAQAIQNRNQAVVALAGKGGCFTSVGHYVFLASVDNENLYILDPLCRTVYKTNGSSKLNILSPGLVSLAAKDVSAARFSNFIIFTKRE